MAAQIVNNYFEASFLKNDEVPLFSLPCQWLLFPIDTNNTTITTHRQTVRNWIITYMSAHQQEITWAQQSPISLTTQLKIFLRFVFMATPFELQI